MSSVAELSKDLAELKSFAEQAQRQNTKTIMAREIQQLERLLKQAEAAQRIQDQKQAVVQEEEKKQEIQGPNG